MEDTSKAIKISGTSFITCIKQVNYSERRAKLANLLKINDRCNFPCVLTETQTLLAGLAPCQPTPLALSSCLNKNITFFE